MTLNDNVSITPTTRHFAVGGGGGAILTSGSGTWTAAVSEPWIVLNSTNGTVGTQPVAYMVSANTNAEPRTGYVYVSGYTHTVTQDGVGADIDADNAEYEWSGGNGTIDVSTTGSTAWKVVPNVDWLYVSPASGMGNGTVRYIVEPFDQVSTRQGTITVAGNTFTVFQYGRRMKLSSYSVTTNYETHVIPITVNALAITQWSVTPNASWISVVDAGNGQGGDMVSIAIAENPSYKKRVGTVRIGTETFTVTQQGRPTAALSFSINPTNSMASVEGANGLIMVTATPDLPWSATSGANWITIYASYTSGFGNGNVVYNASPNPTLSQRTGTITIAPETASGVAAKTHTVTQSAATAALSYNGYEFEAAGESCSVDVSCAGIVQWSIAESLSWITVNGSTSRVGPGTVTLQAAANNTVYPRSGTVTIAGKAFSVSQKARGVEVEYDTKLFGTDGGDGAFYVHPDGNVSWSAVASDPSWIVVFGDTSGTGYGTVQYIVAPYVGTEGARTGWITVGDKKIYITQRAYDLNINPNGTWVTGNSGAGEFGVSAAIGDVWNAIVTEPWITIVSGYDSGTGSGTVRFLYTENTTGKMRSGKILVNGEVYTLEQRARTMVAIGATAEHGGHVSGGGSYDLGTSVTLTAVPDSGYQFSCWTGSVVSVQNPLTLTADVEKNVTAVFAPLPIAFTNVISDTNGVMLAWNNLAWAGTYRIYRGVTSVPSSATVLVELPNGGSCMYLDATGDVNVEYWYWIEAEGPSDEVMSDPMTGRKEKPIAISPINIDVPAGMSTNIAEVIGAEYGDLNKCGGGVLTLSAANGFTGAVTNSGDGLIVADIGSGIPTTAGMVFLSGTYAPLSATTLTVPLGTGPGMFDMSFDHLKIAALNAPLTVNFGGNAEPVVSGGPMNPNANAFHFGWKDDNNEYPITVLNPLVLNSSLTLHTQRNAPVTLAGGVRAAAGVTGRTLDMPNTHPSQFRFTETGTLNIPGNNWNSQGGGTTTFDGGTHEVREISSSRHNFVFTNGAHFVSSVCYLGRDNADYTVNVYAFDSVISNASGNVRLGRDSNASGNWYMRGGELAFAAVSGTPSFAIGDMGRGAFYQESGDVNLRNSSMYLGFNSAYSGLYRIEGGTFNTAQAMIAGYYGTGTVTVAGGTLHVGDVFSLGHEVSGCGRMQMSAGSLGYGGNGMIGRHGRGYLLMSGGALSLNSDREFSIGRFPDGYGSLDIVGGECRYWLPGNNNGKHIGWEGTGVVSVASSGIFSFSNTVHLGTTVTSYGEIDLREGGVFETKTLDMGSGYQKIVTDGGTFRVGGNGSTVNFFNNAANLDESYVGLRGVTFDTQDNTATIGNFALDGHSPGAIRKIGSGTLVFSGLPQTGGGIEVNEGTVKLASGTTVGAAFVAPEPQDGGGNVYPDAPSASLVARNYLLHRWSFNHGSVVDSIAGNVVTIHDDNAAGANIGFKDGYVSLPGGITNGVRYIDLGSGLFGDEDGEFTVEFWARVPNWFGASKLLTIGSSSTQEIFMNIRGGVCARGAGDEPFVSSWKPSDLPGGVMCHISIIIGKAINGKRDVRFLLKDATTGTTYDDTICSNRTFSPILHQSKFAFGYSNHNEVDAKMDIDEVRIWKAALSDAQLTANAMLGPDVLPLLNKEEGTGPVRVAANATFDLGGNTITYPGLAGAGTVRNGSITVETLNVTGTMRLEANVTVTGEVVFSEGSSLVTTGTLNIAGAAVRYVAPISVPSLVLISTESGGRISGVPATMDLGNNRQYKLSIDASVLKLELNVDPLPEIASDSDVTNALAGAVDEIRLCTHISSRAQYDQFRAWVDAKGLEHQAVKDSPRAWFSYAIGASGLVERTFQKSDLTISSLCAVTNGSFSFEVDLQGVSLDTAAKAEHLATVFEVQGSASLNVNSFSSDKVTALLGVSANGKLSVIVTPKAAYERFFVRVRMHADDDGWTVNAHSTVQLWEGGPYWAETNIGAAEPWEHGYYFWWGDVVGYKREGNVWVTSNGTLSNFSFNSSNTPTYGKSIAALQNEGWITAAGILVPEHDAARVHWGCGWRMPTKQEFDDLVSKCDWTWTTMNGVQGYVVRGKGGYTSVSIFLPASGFGDGASYSNAGSIGDYWSSAPYSDNNAWGFFFNSSYRYTRSNYGRYYGYSIRPVQGFVE